MSKLFKLKKWLTIDDAAKHLSSILDEPVKDYDILRFALDGHLKLSVNLVNHATAKEKKIVTFNDVPLLKGLFGDYKVPMGLMLDDGNFLVSVNGKVISIDGVLDLMMLGNERLDIEHQYQQLTSGVEVTLVCIEGTYVEHAETKVMYELQDHFKSDVKSMKDENNYYPAGSLPKDAALVVRTNALSEFIETIATDKKIDKPLSDKERETLLVIIAALAKEANVDIKKISKAGENIADMTQKMGVPVGPTTIETHLKKIPQALEKRFK